MSPPPHQHPSRPALPGLMAAADGVAAQARRDEPEPALPPELLDWRWGLARLDRREGLYFSVLARFGEMSDRLFQRLLVAAGRHDVAAVAQAAQSIKGGALLVGALPLAQVADHLRQLALARDPEADRWIACLGVLQVRTQTRADLLLSRQGGWAEPRG